MGSSKNLDAPSETRKEIILRLFKKVSEGIRYHRDTDRDPVPFQVNWILWLLAWSQLPYFKFYEYHDARRALKRGYGLCSQGAIALWDLLRRAGIDSAVLYFDGHVVTEVHPTENEVWLFDSVYKVILPHSAEEIRKRPELVGQIYQVEPHVLKELQRNYQSPVDRRSKRILGPRLIFENISFMLGWLIPCSLLGWLVGLIVKREM